MPSTFFRQHVQILIWSLVCIVFFPFSGTAQVPDGEEVKSHAYKAAFFHAQNFAEGKSSLSNIAHFLGHVRPLSDRQREDFNTGFLAAYTRSGAQDSLNYVWEHSSDHSGLDADEDFAYKCGYFQGKEAHQFAETERENMITSYITGYLMSIARMGPMESEERASFDKGFLMGYGGDHAQMVIDDLWRRVNEELAKIQC